MQAPMRSVALNIDERGKNMIVEEVFGIEKCQ